MSHSQDNPASGECRDERLEDLLHHPELWRAGQLQRAPEVVPSGYPALDEHLPGGGWPRGALAELLIATAGIGELRLLVPLIRELSRSEVRWVAWINPPFIPYAPALEALGVDVRKILLIHPKSHEQALWALERASRGGTCSLALAWLDERRLELKDTRRLQLAARRGRTLTCLFRPDGAAAVKSMAELRLRVTPDMTSAMSPAMPEQPTTAETRQNSILVDIHKRRGGWPVHGIQLQIADEPGPADIREQLCLWRSQRRQHDEDAAAADPAHPRDRNPLHEPQGTATHRVH